MTVELLYRTEYTKYHFNEVDFFREVNALKYDISGYMSLDDDNNVSTLFYAKPGSIAEMRYFEKKEKPGFGDILRELKDGKTLLFSKDNKLDVYFSLDGLFLVKSIVY